MKSIGLIERFILPDYKNLKHISWASVAVDAVKCTGCALCVKACPADSLMLIEKKARMKPREGKLTGEPGISQCMGCGDCVALCPSGALTLEAPYRWTRFFKVIGRGELTPPRF